MQSFTSVDIDARSCVERFVRTACEVEVVGHGYLSIRQTVPLRIVCSKRRVWLAMKLLSGSFDLAKKWPERRSARTMSEARRAESNGGPSRSRTCIYPLGEGRSSIELWNRATEGTTKNGQWTMRFAIASGSLSIIHYPLSITSKLPLAWNPWGAMKP